MFRPLVVSCEFLASAMLHTCLKLRQPAAHAERKRCTSERGGITPNLRHARQKLMSHCHSSTDSSLPLLSANRWQRKSMEPRRIAVSVAPDCLPTDLIRCCDVAVKH